MAAIPGKQQSFPLSISRIAPSIVLLFFSPSTALGVGHPVHSLTDVRRTEARSAGINRPAGVALSFQVSVYKVDPVESVLARNLLAKDNDRAVDADEMVERGP